MLVYHAPIATAKTPHVRLCIFRLKIEESENEVEDISGGEDAACRICGVEGNENAHEWVGCEECEAWFHAGC